LQRERRERENHYIALHWIKKRVENNLYIYIVCIGGLNVMNVIKRSKRKKSRNTFLFASRSSSTSKKKKRKEEKRLDVAVVKKKSLI
jgi:hypothetical protein